MISRLLRRRCADCGHPSRPGDRLVRTCGYRIHRSHASDPASGFWRRAS
jgi:hypothetical protein